MNDVTGLLVRNCMDQSLQINCKVQETLLVMIDLIKKYYTTIFCWFYLLLMWLLVVLKNTEEMKNDHLFFQIIGDDHYLLWFQNSIEKGNC
jgi:hypothetical protein